MSIEANTVGKRSPGRPKSEIPKVKKGNSSWRPASILDVEGKEDGYRYRWSNKSKDNLAKKAAEGWETVSAIQSSESRNTENNYINDGKSLTSVVEKHDCILQRIPEEVALERDEFFNNESARRIAGLTAHIKKEIGNTGAKAHGDITISSRNGTQVIE
jgi:hypothetical protein